MGTNECGIGSLAAFARESAYLSAQAAHTPSLRLYSLREISLRQRKQRCVPVRADNGSGFIVTAP